MIGLNKKLCVFGTMATSALLILAILVASVKSDVGVGVVSLSSSFGTTTGGGPRMMRGKNMVDDATAASATKNRELVSDQRTSFNCPMAFTSCCHDHHADHYYRTAPAAPPTNR